MVDFKKKLEEEASGKPKPPYKHPPVPNGFTRVEFEEIRTDTDKAVLFVLEYGLLFWIPKSQHRIHWGRPYNNDGSDKINALDIATWYYDKHIKGK